jgi:hypothetical protein
MGIAFGSTHTAVPRQATRVETRFDARQSMQADAASRLGLIQVFATMLKNASDPKIILQMLLSLLSTSGTMAGISLALVGIVNLRITSSKVASIADDIFLFASIGFVIVCYMTFFAIRHIDSPRLQRWTDLIDFTFLLSLTLVVMAGFVTVYAFI